jgi:hypothetical protein
MDCSKIITIGISFLAIVFSAFSVYYSCKADRRSEKLFQAQKISQIQVTPVSFESYLYGTNKEKMGRLVFNITNVSGFKALNVNWDVKWDREWITSWIPVAATGLEMQSKIRELSKQESAELESYKRDSIRKRPDIDPGKSVSPIIQGAFAFDKDKQKTILVRVKWANENGAQMEKNFNYELVLIQAHGAEAFSIISLNP